jgi:hypothetical protein
MTQLNTVQVKSVYYPLTNEEWLKVTQELKPAEIVLLFHLRTMNPFGERATPVGVRDLAKTLSLNPGTVSRALKRLDQLGHIDLELVQVNVKVKSKGLLFERNHPPAEASEASEASEESLPSEVLSTDPECCLQTTPVVSTQHPGSVDNTSLLEALNSKGFGAPKTNKTSKELENKREKRKQKNSEPTRKPEANSLQISDLTTKKEKASGQVAIALKWDKFSAPGDDPDFFEFVVRRTAKLPQPPADAHCAAEGWIRKQGHLLHPQYLAWKESKGRTAPKPADALPLPDKLPELTLEERLAKYQSMWQTPVCRKGIREAIAAHPQWGIQIGKEGPELAEDQTLSQ